MTAMPGTRREALLLAGAATAALALRTADARAASTGDAGVLEAAIAQELALAAAYDGVEAPTALSRTLAAHAHAHVDALGAALRGIGGTPPQKPDASLPKPEQGAASSRSFLASALRLEAAVIARHQAALPTLKDARRLQLLATILAAEGQHLVALRLALGRPPLQGAA